jgi:general secretion pathway protein D
MNRRIVAPAASGSVFSRAVFLFALLGLLAVFGLSSLPLHAAESANGYYKRGQAAEAGQDYDAAYDNYQKAYAKDPKDLRYSTALYRVRVNDSSLHMTKGRKLLAAGNGHAALVEFLRAAEIDPSNEAAQQAIAEVRQKNGEAAPEDETSLPEAAGTEGEIDSMGAPPQLKPLSNEPLTLRMSEDAKVVYQAVGKAAGINVLFDPSYHSDRIQVDLNNVSLEDALRIVGTISNTFWRPVTRDTIFVAANTPVKRRELDEQAVQTFYLSNAWQPVDLTDVQTAIRDVITGAKLYAVASQNAIVMRGTPDELLLAQKLINDLDKPRPEVVVDIAIMEVSKNWERNLGIAWPQSVGVALQAPTSSTSTTTTGTTSTTSTPTLYDLSHLKATDFAVTVGSATANLLLTDSNTKVLQNPRIRSTDGQKATMKIGERIPIATGSYQSTLAASSTGMAETQFSYLDVGVNIEMTPTIHYDGDVTLKIKIEDSSEGSNVTISNVTQPIIIQKVVDQTIRLSAGEASILGGIQEKQDTVSWSGIPGLSSIPILRYLFGSKDHTITDDELVFLVVPHVVRSQSLDQANLRSIDTGVGQSIELHRDADEGPTADSGANPGSGLAPSAPPMRAPASARSSFGTVPGQSAMDAAPAALAQLSAVAETNGNTAAATSPAAPQQSANPAMASFRFTPQPGPVAAGATFQVPVVLDGGANVASVPLQIQYDPAKLSLVNVNSGDFLGRDGQPVAMVHRDDGPGTITIVASRPPGAAGVSGSGVVCVLSFQAKAAGESAIAITRPGVVTSAQKQLPAQGAQVSIQVR